MRWNRPAIHAGYASFRQATAEMLSHAGHVLEYDRMSMPAEAKEARRRALSALQRAEEALTRMEIT